MTKPAWRVACIGFGDMQHSIWSFPPSFYFRVFIDFEPHCSVRPFGFPIPSRCLDNRRYLFSFSLFTPSLPHFYSSPTSFHFSFDLRSHRLLLLCCSAPPLPCIALAIPRARDSLSQVSADSLDSGSHLTRHAIFNISIIVIGTRNLAIPCFFNSLYLVVTYRHKYAHTSLGR